MNKPEPVSGRDRVAKRRSTMRELGFRLKQSWVPDLRRAEVRARIRAEAREIARADREADDMAFIESVSVLHDLPPYEAPLRDDA